MKRVIVTVGPSILYSDESLKEIHSPSYIYRINGAHGNRETVEDYIEDIRRQAPDADIVIDLPGNKVRTANLDDPIRVEIGKKFKLHPHQVNFRDFHKYVKEGDVALADDSTLRFVVQGVEDGEVTFVSESEGLLRNNKGIHIRGINEGLPFLFDKDRELIEVANTRKVSHVGLSFVRTAADIEEAKGLIDPGITVIAKVETRAAVENINSILGAVDHILVDRGDLSTEVGIEKIPAHQKFIVEKALFNNKKVLLATQFLYNMFEKPIPSIAEIIDLYNTLKQGVYGIQLSEETAVGRYPRECLEVIKKMLREIDSEAK